MCSLFQLLFKSVRQFHFSCRLEQWSRSRMEPISKLAYINNAPANPVELFVDLVDAFKQNQSFVPLNIATLDKEYGVLNRTVVYRGLTNKHVTFVTERNSRKYENLVKDPRVSVSFNLGTIDWEGSKSFWQIRLFGDAIELDPTQISHFWAEEPVFAKIRSTICECGAPVDYNELKDAHDKLLEAYENGKDTLPQTSTFTAFKIVPVVWDFYKSETNCIADRVQYRKNASESGYDMLHVAA